jgi:hypothetical protein
MYHQCCTSTKGAGVLCGYLGSGGKVTPCAIAENRLACKCIGKQHQRKARAEEGTLLRLIIEKDVSYFSRD